MVALLSLSLISVALAADTPTRADAESAQKAAWTGLGLSAAGSTMVLAGGFGFYKGPVDAVNRYQGQRDKSAADPSKALVSGVVVGGGLGLSAIGRPVLSVGSTFAATRQQALGGSVTPLFGWMSVGTWAAGVGTYFAAQATESTTLDWTWVALRGASFGTGLTQLLQTHRSMQAGTQSAAPPARPTVRLALSPSGGAVVGTF